MRAGQRPRRAGRRFGQNRAGALQCVRGTAGFAESRSDIRARHPG